MWNKILLHLLVGVGVFANALTNEVQCLWKFTLSNYTGTHATDDLEAPPVLELREVLFPKSDTWSQLLIGSFTCATTHGLLLAASSDGTWAASTYQASDYGNPQLEGLEGLILDVFSSLSGLSMSDDGKAMTLVAGMGNVTFTKEDDDSECDMVNDGSGLLRFLPLPLPPTDSAVGTAQERKLRAAEGKEARTKRTHLEGAGKRGTQELWPQGITSSQAFQVALLEVRNTSSLSERGVMEALSVSTLILHRVDNTKGAGSAGLLSLVVPVKKNTGGVDVALFAAHMEYVLPKQLKVTDNNLKNPGQMENLPVNIGVTIKSVEASPHWVAITSQGKALEEFMINIKTIVAVNTSILTHIATAALGEVSLVSQAADGEKITIKYIEKVTDEI